ncbi:YneF family protein [Paenibacillus sp. CF384]|uniref:YneF family protein n=1 Tax=Paenibacillus sp. CF384 TaxID=1884382 RepID=UPI000B87C052|nr:YneF family protein [Paenibacillus sp. CF384]
MWTVIISIITLIVGAVGGFFAGVWYLRKQLEKMQNDPEMLKKMAKQMGYNMNNQQMQKAQQMMKNQNQQFTKGNNRPGGRR